MPPAADTIRLQQLKKALTDQIVSEKASSSLFITQLQFLHAQLTQYSILGVKNVTQQDINAYLAKIKKLNIVDGSVSEDNSEQLFRDLFNAFIDMHLNHMNMQLKMSQENDCFSLEKLIESLENSDKELLDSWNEMTTEYLSMCESTLKARTKQRHLGEELQDKYDKKGGNVDKLRKDLISKERRHRKQYRTLYEQFETLHKSYEDERVNVNQSFFENRRFAKSLVINEMKMYCDRQEQLLDRMRSNLQHTRATIERFEKVEPQFDAEYELRPTIDLLQYDPVVPSYDERGEGTEVREEEHTRSTSKLNSFLHFLKKSNPGYFHSAMDTDQLGDLNSALLGSPSSKSKSSTSEKTTSVTSSGDDKSNTLNHDVHKNNDSTDDLDESEDSIDLDIRGSHYFQDYEKTEDTVWFESFMDQIMTYTGEEESTSESPSSPKSGGSTAANRRMTRRFDVRMSMSGGVVSPLPTSSTAVDGASVTSPSSSTTSQMSLADIHLLEQEAMKKIETTEGRMAFAMAMNFKRRHTQLNNTAFNILSRLIDRSMSLSYEKNDPNVGRLLLNMTQTFYRMDRPLDSFTPPQKIFLQSKLKEHPVWKEMRFWEGSFYDALSAERVKQMSKKKWKNMGEEQRDEAIAHHQNMVFGMLGTFSFSMLNLGLTEELVRAFVQKMCSINSLNPEYATLIEDNVEATAMALAQSNFRASMRRRSRISSSPIQFKQGFVKTPGSTPGSPNPTSDANAPMEHVYPSAQKSSLSSTPTTNKTSTEPSLPSTTQT